MLAARGFHRPHGPEPFFPRMTLPGFLANATSESLPGLEKAG